VSERITIAELENMLKNFPHSYPDDGIPLLLAKQMIDVMRENERLRDALEAQAAASEGKWPRVNADHVTKQVLSSIDPSHKEE